MKIAEHLEAAGAVCFRINLHAGDSVFWRRRGGIAFRGRFKDWSRFFQTTIDTYAISAIVLLGEERPYHAEAIRVAHARGLDVFVVEMGYLRPDWVTIERDGMSSNSRFPNDPGTIMSSGKDLPEIDQTQRYHQTFLAEAFYDLAYNLSAIFLHFLYPHYQRHAVFHPLAEYAGWITQLLTKRRRASQAKAATLALKKAKKPWFVYPLQLETDFQIRAHSPYHSQKQAIAEVLTSFADYGPPDAHLAIKVHPLDNGLISWRRFVNKLARRLGLDGRVHYFGAGDLEALISGCSGIVTVNSTAALHGLRNGIPVKVLGVAIYDIAGMTDQRRLDAFWQDTHRPDPQLTDAFYRLLAASIQVRGNICSKAGTSAAAVAIATRILNAHVNFPDGDSGRVPRQKPLKYPRNLFLED